MQQSGQRIAPGRIRFLAVEADQLLAPALHASLGRRRPVLDCIESAADALILQDAAQSVGFFVLADHADECRLDTEAYQVDRNVRRAAGTALRLANMYDRHGRFGRNAPGAAEQVAVQHDIAGHDDGRR